MLADHTLFALSISFREIGWVMGLISCAIVCTSFPLLTGFSRGHTILGIIAAVIVVGVIGISITMPYGLLVAWIFGLISGGGMSVLIQLIPKLDQALLSQSEIEAETRKIRGY
jgi:hypothetical protein